MTLSNGDNSPIKIEAVGDDDTDGIKSGGVSDTILQKLGVKNQSQSFEVSGQGVSFQQKLRLIPLLLKLIVL